MAAAALYSLLPVLNALTSERNLWASFSSGDWVFVGFDLTALGFGLLLALAAFKVKQRARSARQDEPAVLTELELVARNS